MSTRSENSRGEEVCQEAAYSISRINIRASLLLLSLAFFLSLSRSRFPRVRRSGGSFYELENRRERGGQSGVGSPNPRLRARPRKSALLVSRRIRSGWAFHEVLVAGTRTRKRRYSRKSQASCFAHVRLRRCTSIPRSSANRRPTLTFCLEMTAR